MSPAKPTPAQVRDRRAKIAAVGLAVVFVGALVIQGPKLLNMIHKSSPPVSASNVNVAAIGATTTASQPTAAASLVPGAVTTTVSSQLNGLARFALKDPFYAQNVTTTTSTTPSAAPAASTKAAATTTTAATTPANPTPAATTPKAPSTTPAATTTTPAVSVPFSVEPSVPPNAAVVLTNGKREIIPVGQDFPSEAPLFKLNSVHTHGKGTSTIRVSVLGGSFTDGVQTVPIEMGKTITFDNQSDGTRYVVKVLRLTTVAASPAGAAPAATTAAATPASSTSSSKG